MRSTPRRIARLLAVYIGAACQVLLLGDPDGPGPGRGGPEAHGPEVRGPETATDI
ncbi:hypothetical protein ACIRYZ_22710 [Kitasatospora sp. NPDC101155]|uniref:hypothetical protein n=1 Tax=Kitasatospora sp. NPDC101155 TaxID=3364097 RepID=UPI00381E5215